MLTSRQKQMREKLLKLIDQSEMEDWNTSTKKGTIGQRYSRRIIDTYLSDKLHVRREFEELTHLSKDSYYKLCGTNELGVGGVKEKTLICMVFGLGTTYEEAVQLFYFYGIYLFGYPEYLQKIDNILWELESEAVKNAKPEDRFTIMYDLLYARGLDTLIGHIDKKGTI